MAERLTPPLPSWVDPERLGNQTHIVHDIVDRFKGRNGHPVSDVVFLQAPTGAGKTLIAELVRRQLGAKAVYSCTTKSLQAQFARDFDYAKVLMGRSNYPTTLGLVDEMGNDVTSLKDSVTALDCTWDADSQVCRWCDSRGNCPYVRARGRASSAPLAILNTSYLITDAVGPRRFVYRDLTIIDECDKLEDELLGHVELHLTNRRMERLGIKPPQFKTKSETWADWINTVALPAANKHYDTLPDMTDATRRDIREIKYMENLLGSIERVGQQISEGKWVYDGYNKDDDRGDVIFRPVYVASWGEDLVWLNGFKFLLMSATILSPEVMANELGLGLKKDKPYSLIDVPSDFPVENRPVHVVPIADMTQDNFDESLPLMVKAINGVMKRHPDERILVHCVSYKLAGALHRECDRSSGRLLCTYDNSFDRELVLQEYKNTNGAVLFASSMDRGVDLPDDLCRVQCIAKVPWPNKGDKRTAQRLYSPGGQSWYNIHTIRTIVQMSGRAVRHRGDYAITYVLDEQFVKLWQKNQRMFPRYFRDAVNFRFNPRLLTEI